MAHPKKKWLQSATVAVLCAAVVVQAAQVSRQVWSLLGPTAARRADGSDAVAPHPRQKIEDLVAAHLFGESPKQEVQQSSTIPERWVLTGTLRGMTPTSGAAILGDTPTTTRYHAVGHEAGGGFRLVEVFADHVTLERAGVRVSVRLPRSFGSSLPGRGIPVIAAQAAELDPQPAGTYVRTFIQPFAARELSASLHRGRGRQRGHIDGMDVYGTGDGSNLAQYGLQRNDIIRAVDGKPINDIEAQHEALQILSQGRLVPVTVERGGSVFSLQLTLSEPDY